jgi:hypothetical protein
MTVPTITPAIAGGYRIRENNSGDLFKELGGAENAVLNHDYYYRDIPPFLVDVLRTNLDSPELRN